jgi:RNase P subunit RPR2
MASKGKRIEQEGARREIERLFVLAEKAAHSAPDGQRLADRYVSLARKAASRNRISLRRYNRLHCRKCSCYFTSKTLRVRTRPNSVVYACIRCGSITRIRKR